MTQDDAAGAGPTAPGEFGAAYWEDRYRRGEGTARLDPSPSLDAEAGALRPGRALDAGCGVGADALWLAARGWQVTAVDVSATALEQGRRTAHAAGSPFAERIAWVHADLTAWQPDPGAFDLVSSHYVHVPGPPEALVARLASWVAPGGDLLVVGHEGGHRHGPAHPAGAQVRTQQVLSGLPEQDWHVLFAGSRTHTVRRPGGDPVVLDDVVVHARRRVARG